MLKFETKTTFKGEAPATATFYFQLGNNHTLLHAIKEFKAGDEWIVFARRKAIGDRVYYRLKDSPLRTLCALSRPIRQEGEEDPYILFLNSMAQQASGYQQFFDKDGQLTAEGQYDSLIPVGPWTYYRPGRSNKVSGQYINGRREGDWLKVKEKPGLDAQLIRKTVYRSGQPAEIYDYRHTGEVSLKKVLTDSTETRYYYLSGGSLKSKITENLDDKTMHIINYSESGIIQEERFLDDQKLIRRYWYNEHGARVKEWEAE
jgi:antitoxin component YwqK of YwqJK toxin-antitoxin module